jgi:putative ABC transport system permease protein
MIGLGLGTGVALVALTVLAAVAAWMGRIGTSRRSVTAALRATVQLGLVSLVIVAVLRSWLAAVAFMAVMVAVASITSARRIGPAGGIGWAGTAIVAGAAPAFAIVLGSGSLPASTVAVVPVAGILIGGAMTATSLAGARTVQTLRERFGEYEAALALGFSRRAAVLELCRPDAASALTPALDQTRTVGLVTLPGAFVGVLLGGGSPLEAGAVQLLVLVGLLAAETIATLVILEFVARGLVPSRAKTA